MSIISHPRITAVILTLNEARNIGNCIARLDWADRIILVDSGSTDKTLELAEGLGCDIYINPWPGFACQRNWALENTEISTPWVLFVDADEEITPDLQLELRETLSATTCDAFYLCSKVMMFGKWVKYSSNYPVWHPRVVRFGSACFKDAVTGHGETWEVNGDTGYLQEPYIHHSFSKGIGYWFSKHNRLSDIESIACMDEREILSDIPAGLFVKDKHRRRQALRALSYRLPCRAVFRFLHQFVFKGGFLDGVAGWTYCTLYFAYEIMISAKVREKRFHDSSSSG
jgi:glycosyltransferase involved in cell wall biosynthesis